MSETTQSSNPYARTASGERRATRVNGETVLTPISVTRTGTNTTNGVKNPRWTEQVRRREQAGTPFVGDRLVATTRPCFIAQRMYNANGSALNPTDVEFWEHSGATLPNVPPDPASLSTTLADNRAKVQAVRKIRKAQTTFKGGVFVGELAQSVRLIADRAKRIKLGLRKYVLDLVLHKKKARRRGRLKDRLDNHPPKLLDFASNTWLEYQLGWAPLLADIDAGAQALAETSVGIGNPTKVIRAVGVDEQVLTNSASNFPQSGAPYFETRLVTRSKVSVRYIACIDVGINSMGNNQRIGFSPDHWLPTLWELMPYSFVIDYFSNIGHVIDAASMVKSQVRWMLLTVRRERSAAYESMTPFYSDIGGKKHQPLGHIPGKSEIRRCKVIRSPYTGSLTPTLEFSFPSYSTQVANVGFLVWSRRALKSYFT